MRFVNTRLPVASFNEIWDNAALRDEYGHSTRLPAASAEGIAIELDERRSRRTARVRP